MKSILTGFAFVAALVAAAFLACSKDDGTTTGMIRGFVTDSAGAPLTGASVLADIAGTPAITNDSGYYEMTDLQPGSTVLSYELASYIPRETTVTVTAGEVTTASVIMMQSRKNVVGELLNTVCHCADDDRYEAKRLKDRYGDRFIYIAYHASSDPSFDGWDPFSAPGSESRRLYYADTFLIGAFMFFNGTTLLTGSGSYESVVDSLLGGTSPLHVILAGNYSSTSGTGSVSAEIAAVDSIAHDDLQVRFVVYEIGPIRYLPPSPPETLYHYIAVDVLAPEDLTIAEGETRVITRDFTVPDTIGGTIPPFHAVNKENVGIAVFVQSEGTKEVLQSASIDY